MKPIEFGGVLLLPMHICWVSFEDIQDYGNPGAKSITLHLSDGSSHTEHYATAFPKLQEIWKN